MSAWTAMFAAFLIVALTGSEVMGSLSQLPLHRVRRGGLVGSYGSGLGSYSGFAQGHHRVRRGGLIGSYGSGLGDYAGFGGGHATAISGSGAHGPSAADLANRAAGVAIGDLGYQQQAAWNAAQGAAQHVASQAAGAASIAQNAAAAKYSQAAAITQAAQAATGAAFAEAANAAKVAKTVQAAEAFKQWAKDQAASLTQARRYAESNVGLTNNLFASALNAVDTQSAQEWNARQVASNLQTQEKLAFDDLASSTNAASQASSAAKTAYLRAKGHGHTGLGIGSGAGFGSGFGFGGGGGSFGGGGGGGYGY